MENKNRVVQSIRRYLGYPKRYRDGLRGTLSFIETNLDESVIFGGMIREFALGNTRQFRSDIDIVTRSTREEVRKAIAEFSPKQNKFGGFRFSVGTQLYDIWSFDDTWAFKNGLIDGSALQDIFKTTFFNLDAVAYSLQNRKLSCSATFLYELSERILDLNLLENPSPSAMARRAIRMALINRLQVTPRLGEFILQHANLVNLDDLSRTYVKALKSFRSSDSEANFSFIAQASLFSGGQQMDVVKPQLTTVLSQSRCPARDEKELEHLIF